MHQLVNIHSQTSSLIISYNLDSQHSFAPVCHTTVKKNESNGKNGGRSKTVQKGKKHTDEEDASSDSDDDLGSLGFDRDDTQLALKKALKKQLRKPVDVHVFKTIKNALKSTISRVILLGDPGNCYYLREEHVQQLLGLYWNNNHPGEPLPSWIGTITRYTIRREEYGAESLYLRTSTGNTRSRIGFIVTIPESEESTFNDVTKNVVALIFKLFKKRKGNPAGVLALDYIRESSPQGGKRGLYGHLLETSRGDEKALEQRMTVELNDYFADGPVFHYDDYLNRYLVDFDIKEILEKYVGANSWEDVSKETRKACYKNYPRLKLPDWATIYKERF
jgi:hypothetical protein